MKLINILDRQLADYTHQIRLSRGRFLPFIATTISALIKAKFSDAELKLLKSFFRETIQYYPASTELLSIYDQVPARFAFGKIYPILDRHLQEKLITSYLSLFGMQNDQGKSPLTVEQAENLLLAIKEHSKYFSSQITDIKRALEKMFFDYQYIKVFNDVKSKKLFLTEKVINNFINSITAEESGDSEFIKKLKYLYGLSLEDNVEAVLGKLLGLFQFENSREPEQQRIQLAELTRKLISKLKPQINASEDNKEINEMSGILASWYTQNADWENRVHYAILAIELSTVDGNTSAPQLETIIKSFVNDAPSNVIQKLGRKNIEYFASKYPDEFRSSAIKDLQILELGIKGLPSDQLPSLVTNLLLKSRELQTAEEKKPYFDKIVQLKASNDINLIGQFHSELLAIKLLEPDFVKTYISANRGKLFSAPQKRELKVKSAGRI